MSKFASVAQKSPLPHRFLHRRLWDSEKLMGDMYTQGIERFDRDHVRLVGLPCRADTGTWQPFWKGVKHGEGQHVCCMRPFQGYRGIVPCFVLCVGGPNLRMLLANLQHVCQREQYSARV